MKVGIINGPNLNLLGQREPEIYGEHGFDSYLDQLRLKFPQHQIEYFQSNNEGELIDAIHRMATECDGLILNPAAYTHTSLALGDAVKGINCPLIEVHISNVYQRENFRHKSYISSAAKGTISGLGLQVYKLALLAFIAEG